MTEGFPEITGILFCLTVAATIGWFYFACRSKVFLALALVWAALQSIFALNGLYQSTEVFPPKLLLMGVLPTLLMMLIVFISAKGRAFMDNIDLKLLTSFHSIRIPVEIVLLLLFHRGLIPVDMTFEGTNFDILSGLTAIPVAWLAFRAGNIRKPLLLAWNAVCLILLIYIVTTAIRALPGPLQQIAFDQPNIAVLSFPFHLLPALVVPLVFFAHLIAFRRLLKK